MKCDECDRQIETPSICDVCRLTKLDLEADEAWPVFLAQLRYGAKELDAISDSMLGWQYIGGDVRHEKTSKGVEVGQVYAMAFSKHEGMQNGAQVVFSHENGRPLITVTRGNLAFHDWKAVFTPSTPFHLINDALNAASKQ